jgi:hypothetical protein
MKHHESDTYEQLTSEYHIAIKKKSFMTLYYYYLHISYSGFISLQTLNLLNLLFYRSITSGNIT